MCRLVRTEREKQVTHFQRFKRLTFWNKVGVLASLATIVSLVLVVAKFMWNLIAVGPIIQLDAGIKFDYLYLQNFRSLETYDSKWNFGNGAPPDARQLGKFRYHGLHPLMWVRVSNRSAGPISIRAIDHQIRYGDFQANRGTWARYRSEIAGAERSFPLYLSAHEETILYLNLPWPITEEMRNRLSGLRDDSVYNSKQFVEAFLESTSTRVMGNSPGLAQLTREYLVDDLSKQSHGNGTTEGSIWLQARTADNDSFQARVPLSRAGSLDPHEENPIVVFSSVKK
jgi:hypothetical protein